MANIVLVGAQWGDEGKGKVIDYLTDKVDVVVRSQGGKQCGTHRRCWREEIHPSSDSVRHSKEGETLCDRQWCRD